MKWKQIMKLFLPCWTYLIYNCVLQICKYENESTISLPYAMQTLLVLQ